ncbi:50S ribosomal protein L33 [Xylariaceae sp. FL0662B]|nr:50S ribosomal protein L33 [Xylariaceae sp. FL0662B]
MAKKQKSRLIPVRLISMAMTGFFYTFTRPRTARPMSMLKYDPVGTSPSASPRLIPLEENALVRYLCTVA